MPKIAPKDRLIVALDFDNADHALALVTQLNGAAAFFKVGYELFLSAGWDVVREISRQGNNVFLDLKMDDIEATIESAVRRVADLGLVQFLTIYGGRATAEAARLGKGDADLKILQITLLTSMNAGDLAELKLVGPDDSYKFRDSAQYVRWRAEQAKRHGADGVISSGENAKMLRETFGPEFLVVCPGIRPAGNATQEHKRPCTPHDAVRDGADYIVVGRPIRDDKNPHDAATRISDEIESGLAAR